MRSQRGFRGLGFGFRGLGLRVYKGVLYACLHDACTFLSVCMHACMHQGRMDGRMDGCIDGWIMDARMQGWMEHARMDEMMFRISSGAVLAFRAPAPQ